MNVFRFFRERNRRAAQFIGFPVAVDLSICEPIPSIADVRIFEPTHVHVRTGKQYMLTSIGERLEVTGDDAYPLAEYENAEGEQFAQRAERFLDGRFRELPL